MKTQRQEEPMKLSFPRTAFLILVLMSIPVLAFGQARLTGGDLSGTVQDASNAVLPGVTVTATNLATNQVRTDVTESDGTYYIAALPAGVYDVSAELSGFATQRKSGVRLQLGQRLPLDFTLSPGAEEAITVTASSTLVDTTEPAVATVVSQEQIDSLPRTAATSSASACSPRA
jgi:hypothetical protein